MPVLSLKSEVSVRFNLVLTALDSRIFDSLISLFVFLIALIMLFFSFSLALRDSSLEERIENDDSSEAEAFGRPAVFYSLSEA